MNNPTHSELVERGTRWLRNSLNCSVVLSELVTEARSREIPDVIGWVNNRCILVECKCSRSDFKADLKKAARLEYFPYALGHWRFYLASPGIIGLVDLPIGWGLYEVTGKSVKFAGGRKYSNAEQPPFESDRVSEVSMLLSALRRKTDK